MPRPFFVLLALALALVFAPSRARAQVEVIVPFDRGGGVALTLRDPAAAPPGWETPAFAPRAADGWRPLDGPLRSRNHDACGASARFTPWPETDRVALARYAFDLPSVCAAGDGGVVVVQVRYAAAFLAAFVNGARVSVLPRRERCERDGRPSVTFGVPAAALRARGNVLAVAVGDEGRREAYYDQQVGLAFAPACVFPWLRCDPARGRCVGCDRLRACPPGTACEAGACVECGAAAPCRAGAFCVEGRCAACAPPGTGCAAPRPHCDPRAGCVACRPDDPATCAGSAGGAVCLGDGEAAACGCVTDAHCGPPASGRYCDLARRRCADGCVNAPGRNGCPSGRVCSAPAGAAGECVRGCAANTDCPRDRPRCEAGACVCRESGDCAGADPARPVCLDATRTCVRCRQGDAMACAGDPRGGRCLEDGTCGCDEDTDCPRGRVCDPEARACVEGCRAFLPDRGCGPGLVCSARGGEAGRCVAPPPDGGVADGGTLDGGATADLGPGNTGRQFRGGGGCDCAAAPGARGAWGGAAALAACALAAGLGRRRGRLAARATCASLGTTKRWRDRW